MEPRAEDGHKQRRWLWLLLLIALTMSVICVYSSTFLALSLWPTEIAHANMLAMNEADYSRDQSPTRFAPVSTQLIIQATTDSSGLIITVTPAALLPEQPQAANTPVFIAHITATPSPTPIKALPTAVISTATSPAATAEPATATPFPTIKPSVAASATATKEKETATAVPTLPASQTPSATHTAVPPTPTLTATPQPTLPAPPTHTPRPATQTPVPTASATATITPMPTATPTGTLPPTLPATATATASSTPTNTATAVNTPTNTATATLMATNTPDATAFPTNTATATATILPTNTATATLLPPPTNTSTPTPCSGNLPGGEPNIGPPNGTIALVACGNSILVDLGATNAIAVSGSAEPAFDLVYYEFENPATFINLDWVLIEASINGSGGWVQVFYWGNGSLDTNTNIGQAGYGTSGESDNQTIPFSDLYNGNSPGIAIDLDAVAPAGNYQWLRITSPLGEDNDGAEVDSVEPLP